MPHLLTEDEELDLLNKLEGLREHIELLKNGITAWKLKIIYEYAVTINKVISKAWTRYKSLKNQTS